MGHPHGPAAILMVSSNYVWLMIGWTVSTDRGGWQSEGKEDLDWTVLLEWGQQKEMGQHFKYLQISVNQYFLANQGMILQNNVWVKDAFKVHGRPLDFNIAEYEKLTYQISHSTDK